MSDSKHYHPIKPTPHGGEDSWNRAESILANPQPGGPDVILTPNAPVDSGNRSGKYRPLSLSIARKAGNSNPASSAQKKISTLSELIAFIQSFAETEGKPEEWTRMHITTVSFISRVAGCSKDGKQAIGWEAEAAAAISRGAINATGSNMKEAITSLAPGKIATAILRALRAMYTAQRSYEAYGLWDFIQKSTDSMLGSAFEQMAGLQMQDLTLNTNNTRASIARNDTNRRDMVELGHRIGIKACGGMTLEHSCPNGSGAGACATARTCCDG